ncbi:MAG TPA: hypothetical protein P5528_09545 [Steroidobacteraceae bacterium]|nr:hypothetical protein [Steroidobacteraceae bacterium]HRX89676.1 hypothetical protein [Steroidobacteraceae bacterium]
MKTTHTLAIAVAIGSITTAAAAPGDKRAQCYDFSGLEVGTTYHIDDTVDARHATITFRPYISNGSPVGEAANFAEAQQAKIAGGEPPEMGIKTLAIQVQPNQPVTQVRMKLAQSITPTGGYGNANIEVNGEKHESPDGFAGMNGKRLGGAEIASSFTNDSGNWHVGTLELRAKPGGAITSFTIGGHTMRLDDMCFARSAPRVKRTNGVIKDALPLRKS